MFACVCMCIFVHACKGLRLMLGVFLHHSELNGFGLSSQFAPRDCLTLTPIGWDYGLFHGWCGPNSDRHTYRVLTLSHLPSLNLLLLMLGIEPEASAF